MWLWRPSAEDGAFLAREGQDPPPEVVAPASAPVPDPTRARVHPLPPSAPAKAHGAMPPGGQESTQRVLLATGRRCGRQERR
jgi:hypothetical protein